MADPIFFQNLLKQVDQPAVFIGMVNTWMENSFRETGCVIMDNFLTDLMDEQREPRSKVDEDQLFLLLAMWMKQTSLDLRKAMMFNTDHMVGLSCLAQNDDVELLQGVFDHDVFLHPSSTQVSIMFVSRLLMCTNVDKSLYHILSSPAFARIVGGGTQCQLAGRSVDIEPLDIETLMWRIFTSNSHNGQQIATQVKNVVLDNLNEIAVFAVLDVVASGDPKAKVSKDFLDDPRFLQWEHKDECLVRYCQRIDTIFPPKLNRHFPEILDVAVCNCAYILIEAAGLGVPLPTVHTNLGVVLKDHPQAIGVVQQTIERLDAVATPSLSHFPHPDIEILLEQLSDEDLQQWRAQGWSRDEQFSISQYPRFVKAGLVEHITHTGLSRKRMI